MEKNQDVTKKIFKEHGDEREAEGAKWYNDRKAARENEAKQT
jgi:hypothetical protein